METSPELSSLVFPFLPCIQKLEQFSVVDGVSTFFILVYLTLKLLACQHQVSLNYMYTHEFGYYHNTGLK